ncbi:MAG: hypothetical protein VX028_03710 [Nanoarchaeota archaeon]|nr:hypothetical protein [Nanoarchaeota archaeon]
MKIVLALLFTLFIVGCSVQEEVASSDSFGDSIVLERSGMYTMPEFGIQIYTLTDSNLNVKIYHYNGSLTKEANYSLHPGITYQYFEEFERINFTELDDNYRSTVPIADVGQGVVTYNNHSVLITPYISRGNPSEIADIIESLNSLFQEVNMSNLYQRDDSLNENEELKVDEVITYTYTGVQCVEEPWNEWYKSQEFDPMEDRLGESEIIRVYYEIKGIEIEMVERIDSEMMQCQACEVCSKGYSFEVQVVGVQKILEQDGWVVKE